jgi:hypothetical protein
VHWSFGLNIECITSVQQVKQNDSKMWVLINSTKKPFFLQFIAKKKKKKKKKSGRVPVGFPSGRVKRVPVKTNGAGQ